MQTKFNADISTTAQKEMQTEFLNTSFAYALIRTNNLRVQFFILTAFWHVEPWYFNDVNLKNKFFFVFKVQILNDQSISGNSKFSKSGCLATALFVSIKPQISPMGFRMIALRHPYTQTKETTIFWS